MTRVLAFDFGASSGRAIVACFDNGNLTMREVHRFENTPIEKDGHLRWDFKTLLCEVYTGIENAGELDSIAFDTWGVDFGLIGENNELLELPVHYRDKRTSDALINAAEKMPLQRLYQETGVQIMPINTLFQIVAKQKDSPELLLKAKKLLFMADLFAYFLCNNAVCERSIASTSQMLSPVSDKWAHGVLKAFNIDESLFAPLAKSGTIIGEYKGAKVIAVAGHDTQCAVGALPTNEREVAFLSCGTWSLLGCELDKPIFTDITLSNEIGANDKINYLKNIIGLWLIQESRREYKRQGHDYSYAQLEKEALSAKPFRCFINPDNSVFASIGDIPARIKFFCEQSGQEVPNTTGEVMRCIYESLALKYRYAIDQLKAVTNKSFKALHVLGGGAKDGLLCQMTANACGISVVAGPIEATALGNIIIQLKALGALSTLEEGRELIARTQHLTYFEPQNSNAWNEAYEKYKQILSENEA